MITLYVILLILLYVFWRLISNRFDKRFKDVNKISEHTVKKYEGVSFGVNKIKILMETVFYMCVIVLLFISAFEYDFSDGRELAYVGVGMLLFIITYLRMLVLTYSSIRYDADTIYVQRGLKRTEISLDKVKRVDRLNAHTSVITEDNLWIRYIPIHFKNSHIIYKLLLDREQENVE